jgi:hypothetical protein
MLKTINNDLIIIFLIVKNTCSSLLVIVINLVNIIYLFAIKLSLKSRSKWWKLWHTFKGMRALEEKQILQNQSTGESTK